MLRSCEFRTNTFTYAIILATDLDCDSHLFFRSHKYLVASARAPIVKVALGTHLGHMLWKFHEYACRTWTACFLFIFLRDCLTLMQQITLLKGSFILYWYLVWIWKEGFCLDTYISFNIAFIWRNQFVSSYRMHRITVLY